MGRNKGNAVMSPFLSKVMLAMVIEAAGTGTDIQKEIQTLWWEPETEVETRNYGKTFGSMLVRTCQSVTRNSQL